MGLCFCLFWSRELFPLVILLPHYLGLNSILPSSSTFPFLLPWQQVGDSWREDAAGGGAFETGMKLVSAAAPAPRSAHEVSAEGQLCTLVLFFLQLHRCPSTALWEGCFYVSCFSLSVSLWSFTTSTCSCRACQCGCMTQ